MQNKKLDFRILFELWHKYRTIRFLLYVSALKGKNQMNKVIFL